MAIPTEHGGWALTAEPVVLGLAVAPSLPGGLLGVAAFVAFLLRTPLGLALVDRRRDRVLDRTRRAWVVVAVEGVLLAALVGGALLTAEAPFWAPLALAAPLVALELWFDMRSRSRRLVPELAGACGIASVAAAIVLAGGGSASVATATWLVLVARSTTSIPHVRALIAQLHQRRQARWIGVVTDLVALGALIAAVVIDPAVAAGAIAVVVVIAAQRLGDRRPTRAALVGARQLAFGLVVVVATAVGVHGA